MKTVKTLVFAILAGMFVSVGGAAFLSVDSKPLGAVFFIIGLFAICTMGLNLYTGKVCYIFDNKPSYLLDLAVIWVGNLIGTFLTASLFRMTRISGISERSAEMCQIKLDDSLMSIFILAVFCNILIYLAVDGFKNNPHELGKYLSLFFGVVVFIMCGFEHCIANMFYISVAGLWSGKAFLMILVNTLGNSVGGLLIPVLKKSFSSQEVKQ